MVFFGCCFFSFNFSLYWRNKRSGAHHLAAAEKCPSFSSRAAQLLYSSARTGSSAGSRALARAMASLRTTHQAQILISQSR